ncbi:GGDEF domain-containing protein [Lapidilactobacillus luobeiensis]|uniref:GGDEF domain-containing protein n=1 Tax=Lapidilactobacillus luobeiensis TaxID=2950371 RepID=UPI0021C41EB3|nr:GGDEF domain-containing protein [Lapidilactobacillus luobeiensis]
MIEISGVTLIVMELLTIFGTLFIFQYVGNVYTRRHSNDVVWVGKMDWQLRLLTAILFSVVGILLVLFQKLTASDPRTSVNLVIASMIMITMFVGYDVVVIAFDITALFYFIIHGIDPGTLAYVVFYSLLFIAVLLIGEQNKLGPWLKLLIFNASGAVYWVTTYLFYAYITRQLKMTPQRLSYYILQMVILISVPYIVAYSMQQNQLSVFKRTQEVYLDGLTNVYNYHAFNLNLEHAFQHSKEKKLALSMMVLDLDHFKTINDTYGHLAGNFILVHFCEVVRDQFPSGSDYKLYRIGGEEFAIIFTEADRSVALQLAEKIEANVREEDFIYKETRIPLTFSGGLSEVVGADGTSREFYDRVDGLTYLAKQNGRDQIVTRMTSGD